MGDGENIVLSILNGIFPKLKKENKAQVIEDLDELDDKELIVNSVKKSYDTSATHKAYGTAVVALGLTSIGLLINSLVKGANFGTPLYSAGMIMSSGWSAHHISRAVNVDTYIKIVEEYIAQKYPEEMPALEEYKKELSLGGRVKSLFKKKNQKI